MPSIADQIRRALEKKGGLTSEIMAPLARTYCDEVQEVNRRIDEAVSLLRKGLRSEAIQRASLSPNAIERAAELDFPEVEEWLEILQFLEIPVPSLIDHDGARQINEAIVETQPLDELLNQHRKLAIAKAPLQWRLRVLRRVAQVDPMNGVWEEDLEAWEDVRLKQIPRELQMAIKEKDTGAVTAIRDELSSQSWRVEPSARLIEQAQSAANQFDDEANTEHLRQLAEQIHDAFSQFDEPLARALREQWRQIQKQLHGPVSMDLQEQIGPAFAWLDEMDREAQNREERTEALNRLEAALDKQLSAPDLHRVYQRANRFDEPIPMELEQRFRVTVAEHELRAKRKTQAVLASIVAAALLVAGWIGVRQWRTYEARRIQTASGQLEELLSEGKLDEARQFRDQIRATQPKVSGAAEIASLSSQLDGALKEESERAAQLQSYLEQANHEDPSKIDGASLAKAASLATTEREKADVFAIQRRRDQWERDRQAEHTKLALDQLEQYRAQLESIESQSASLENIEIVGNLIDKIDDIGTEYPRRSAKTDSQIKTLKNRAFAVRDAMGKQTRDLEVRRNATKRLVGSKSLPAFADNLDAFVRDVPKSPMAKEFSQAAQEKPLWEHISDANELMKLIRNSLVGGISPEEASEILTKHQNLANSVVINAATESLPGISEKLKQVQNRPVLLDKVFNDFALQTVAELVTTEVSSPDSPTGKIRYFLYYSHFDQFRDRFRDTGRVGIEVVVNESAAVQKIGFDGPLEIIPEPRATIRWLVNQKVDRRAAFLSDWEGAFLKTAADLRLRPDLDGIVKESLLLQLLEGGSEGSEFMQRSMRDAIKLLNRRKEKRKRWFVAKPLESSLDPDVESMVVPDLSKAFRERQDEWRRIHAATQREFSWVGCLLRHEVGSILPQINNAPDRDGRLFVVRPAISDPNKADFAEVGKWQNGQAVLSTAQRDLVAGRPLFFLPSLQQRDVLNQVSVEHNRRGTTRL